MSKLNPNDPAFPWEDMQDTTGLPRPSPGITIRAHFAAMVTQGICAHPDTWGSDAQEIAKHAVSVADALIAELNKEKP